MVLTLFLVACGDNTSTSPPVATTTTTAATTTAAAATTTSAPTGNNDLGGVPPYPGATIINVPDTIKTQFMTSVTSSVKNPQLGAFTTTDAGAKVKTFYTDYFSKNGWNDLSASLGAAASQFDQMGGFFLVYTKDKSAFVVIGLPGAAAAGLGVDASSVPATGSLVLGFVGQTP